MVFSWFPWFFKEVSWFFMVFGWFPWFFKAVSWFFMIFGWFSWFFKVFGWFPWFFKVVSWFFMNPDQLADLSSPFWSCSYSYWALCSEDWTFFATTNFPPNIEQPVIHNQMQTPHCCGFLELFTAAKNCHEEPRRATGQKETVEMRGHEFVIPSAGLSPK